MIPSDVGFMFTGFILFLPLLVLIIYVIGKIRRADPSKQRKYVALTLIIIVIVSVSTIIVVNLPPSRQVELDIALNLRSNSTEHESTYQYHWDAHGTRTDVFGIHIDWNKQYGEAHNYGTGVLTELLLDRGIEDFCIQWTELEPFANDTWTLRIDFFLGMIFDGELSLRGDNQSAHVDDFRTTDTQFSSDLLEGLDALGIEGLEIWMNITLRIAAGVLRNCFWEISNDFEIMNDIEMLATDIVFGMIS